MLEFKSTFNQAYQFQARLLVVAAVVNVDIYVQIGPVIIALLGEDPR